MLYLDDGKESLFPVCFIYSYLKFFMIHVLFQYVSILFLCLIYLLLKFLLEHVFEVMKHVVPNFQVGVGNYHFVF